MLTSIAEKLWGTQVCDADYVSPGKSTVADDSDQTCLHDVDQQSGSSSCESVHNRDDLICSLWEVDGNDARELMETSQVSFEDKKIIFQNTMKREEKRSFLYTDIVHFHQQEEDIFQWIIKKGNDNLEEFGVAFSTPKDFCHSIQFNQKIRPMLRQSAIQLCRENVVYQEYDNVDKTWISIHNQSSISILQREKDFEAYLVVENLQNPATDTTPTETTTTTETVIADSLGSTNQSTNTITEICISHEEYIFPQTEEMLLTWWGVAEEGETNRKMKSVRFENGETMNNVIDTFKRVLKQHSSNGDIDMTYDENDFVCNTENDIELLESENIDPTMIVSRDTSRNIVTKDAKSKIHKMMYVGGSNTFVVRSSIGSRSTRETQLDVLKFEEEGEKIVSTISGEKLSYRGENNLCPQKALLHDNQSKLLFLDEGNNEQVYLMDIENEKIVETYNAGNDMKIQNILETSRGSSTQSDPTFLCNNPTAIFKMDTRMSNKDNEKNTRNSSSNDMARSSTLSYATNVQFTAGATDDNGHILMGSKVGDLRLYDGEINKEGKLKRAKTHLQGLGDPLLHVAVTRDGGWILGTCTKYLVLFPVKLASTGKTGFVTALGKSKPPPIVLKPTIDDIIKYNLSDLSFNKAEFNEEETAIVTSTGNLAIIWNFSKALKQSSQSVDINSYTIQSVNDYIKDVNFLQTDHRTQQSTIVMATPCGVHTKSIVQSS